MEPNEPAEQPSAPGAVPSESSFARMGLVFYGALAAAAVVWRVGFYHEPIFLLAAPTQPPVEIFWVRDAVLGAAVAGILIGISDWMTRKTRWGEDLARAMAQALGRLSIPNAVLLAVASGTAEELFFRGALQPRAGLILSSLLFGCVHFVPRREFLPWTGFAIVAGFLFGGLFVWTGNLLAPIVAHIVVNAVNLPMLVRRYGPSSPEAGEPEGPDASL